MKHENKFVVTSKNRKRISNEMRTDYIHANTAPSGERTSNGQVQREETSNSKTTSSFASVPNSITKSSGTNIQMKSNNKNKKSMLKGNFKNVTTKKGGGPNAPKQGWKKQHTISNIQSNRKKALSNSRIAATIIVQLSGEMANHLSHIAHGLGLQWWAKDEFGIETNLMLRHDTGANAKSAKPKWKRARNDLLCFEEIGTWDVTLGNTKDYDQARKLQQQWLGSRQDQVFGLINSQHATDIQKGLSFFKSNILSDPTKPKLTTTTTTSSNPNTTIHLPYLLSETFDIFPMIDKYYDKYRQLFRFNQTACCKQRPYANESVFHFRNFESELPPRRAYDMGFAEMGPEQVAKIVFSTKGNGTSYNQPLSFDPSSSTKTLPTNTFGVAVTTRIPNSAARAYVSALESIGQIPSRLIVDQTGVEDFCFLQSSQKELVGSARSTYTLWAGLLGFSKPIVRLLLFDTWGIRRRHGDDFQNRFTYSWTHPELSHRVKFEVHASEEIQKT